jgi:molybdate transport system substrate-binding protein
VRGALAAALAIGACASGCGGGRPALTVSAAASLRAAFIAYAHSFHAARVRENFAGSDLLAAQIRLGVRPDVFAAANVKLPGDLYRAGLVERPVVFAANRLVLAVPAGSTKVGSLGDLERSGVALAVGSPSVPIGAYTRQVLAPLGARGARILARARSREPDVTGIVGKLIEGAVDAGFVYITDVRAARGKLRAIELPAGLQPRVAYAAAVVRGSARGTQARAFVAGLLQGAGAAALRRAGFEPAPH